MPTNEPIKRDRKTKMGVQEALRYVREIPGEPLRLHIPSRTHRNNEYLVDLEEFDFNGQCGCLDFECHHQPQTKLAGLKPSNDTRCWHIMVGRTYFLNRELRRIARIMHGGVK